MKICVFHMYQYDYYKNKKIYNHWPFVLQDLTEKMKQSPVFAVFRMFLLGLTILVQVSARKDEALFCAGMSAVTFTCWVWIKEQYHRYS